MGMKERERGGLREGGGYHDDQARLQRGARMQGGGGKEKGGSERKAIHFHQSVDADHSSGSGGERRRNPDLLRSQSASPSLPHLSTHERGSSAKARKEGKREKVGSRQAGAEKASSSAKPPFARHVPAVNSSLHHTQGGGGEGEAEQSESGSGGRGQASSRIYRGGRGGEERREGAASPSPDPLDGGGEGHVMGGTFSHIQHAPYFAHLTDVKDTTKERGGVNGRGGTNREVGPSSSTATSAMLQHHGSTAAVMDNNWIEQYRKRLQARQAEDISVRRNAELAVGSAPLDDLYSYKRSHDSGKKKKEKGGDAVEDEYAAAVRRRDKLQEELEVARVRQHEQTAQVLRMRESIERRYL
uniref:Uncharacterized protein n=1 Tax=Palpitomonas bilix TaxID=652834 RepID=A0A7S3G5Y3_9EUKA